MVISCESASSGHHALINNDGDISTNQSPLWFQTLSSGPPDHFPARQSVQAEQRKTTKNLNNSVTSFQVQK